MPALKLKVLSLDGVKYVPLARTLIDHWQVVGNVLAAGQQMACMKGSESTLKTLGSSFLEGRDKFG